MRPRAALAQPPWVVRRTSVQVLLVIVVVAFLCNSAVSHTDEGLPWEVTLTGACVFGVVFSAYYAQKTEVALSICRHAMDYS